MNVIKGFIVGASMLVPGFSGGTMAMILGIYDKLIASLSGILSFSKNENYFIKNKSNFLIVILFSIGALLGMILVSKPLSVIIEKFFTISCFFFMGAALGGFNAVYNKTKSYKFNYMSVFYIILGAAIVYLISIIPEGFFNSDNNRGKSLTYFILIVAGFISAIALILPGFIYVFIAWHLSRDNKRSSKSLYSLFNSFMFWFDFRNNFNYKNFGILDVALC